MWPSLAKLEACFAQRWAASYIMPKPGQPCKTELLAEEKNWHRSIQARMWALRPVEDLITNLADVEFDNHDWPIIFGQIG